jgi:hypothetical protein
MRARVGDHLARFRAAGYRDQAAESTGRVSWASIADDAVSVDLTGVLSQYVP